MLTIETKSLLEPVSAENPAGANLEYDSAFLELERSAQAKPEQQMGSTIIPAEPPDFSAVFKQAVALFARTKDLRVANHLVQALVSDSGFLGMSEGLGLVQGLLGQYWTTVHPELDPEDGNDPTMRMTALASLVTPDAVSRLRAAPLVQSRSFGPIGLREIAIANGELPQPAEGPKYEPNMVEATFTEADFEALTTLEAALDKANERLKGIESILEEHAAGSAPDFKPLKQVLHQAAAALRPRLETRRAEAAAAAAETAGPVATGSAGTGRPATAGEISSREDVVRMLDKLCAYYARHEPSSPLPLLLQRCKRLVPMSFKEIVNDLAPDALSKVELVVGKTEK